MNNSVKKSLQMLSRSCENPIPRPTASFPHIVGEYERFDKVIDVNNEEDEARRLIVVENITGRLASYKNRLRERGIRHGLVSAFRPLLSKSCCVSDVKVATMLYHLMPSDCTFEQDAPLTPARYKNVMELDHVIPLSWVWTHKSIFKGNVLRTNLIVGWFNILPLPYHTNRQKANYSPTRGDIERNIANKTAYFEQHLQGYDPVWFNALVDEYVSVYDDICACIHKANIGKHKSTSRHAIANAP